ncbi:hypothetical protein J8657_19275 [Dickeya oryzae]|uniref:Uncharacterized protein n=1 Tax=Dickeya oryzae TaxID=1240404 RepID=A0ABS5BH08_9GAMM|nr:hypothetical protein [Dickeya oryzae]MBP2859740.1 hypothetical protein [Dickeya oryzae]
MLSRIVNIVARVLAAKLIADAEQRISQAECQMNEALQLAADAERRRRNAAATAERRRRKLERLKQAVTVENTLSKEFVMDSNPAVAAIEYALTLRPDECRTFLHLWSYGEFDALRKEWENIPDEVFIGADPFFNKDNVY